MKIQRFSGQDVQEALRQARRALGPEAVILQTRRLPATGLKKLIGRPRVEVLAAVDTPGPAGQPTPRNGIGTSAASRPKMLPPPAPRPAARSVELSGGPSTGKAVGARAPAGSDHGRSDSTGAHASLGSEELRRELAAVRRELASLRAQFAWLQSRPGPEANALAGERRQSLESLAQRLLSGVVTQTIEIREGACTKVAMVGPTGVGKTTTIAKLAAVAARVERRRVALITMDTFRIGAVEQLETYARLLDVPLSVVHSAEDMKYARERCADYDLVLIDTVGRAPGNTEQIEELGGLLSLAEPDEIHLALDTRGSHATLRSVLRGFSPLRPTQLLLSKLDETVCLEDALAAALEGGLPLSYVTTGQRVPEDLAAADLDQLAYWLLGGV